MGRYNTVLERIRQIVGAARRLVALTGAGVSAESGVPTFRGEEGLWRSFRAEDLATPGAFARDPALVWEWYDWRRSVIARAQPNAAHLALAAAKLTLITQNVDGLHDLAGSRGVVKLHGDIWTLRCQACQRSWEDRRPSLPQLPPACECGGMARPGVVWFGEGLPAEQWRAAEEAAESCDVLLVIGTSAVVYPAASLVPLARRAGAAVIEINVAGTAVSGIAHHSLRGTAAEIVPQLLAPQGAAA